MAELTLEGRVVAVEPLGSGGASGNDLERVSLDDGTQLVRKRVSPEWDWISRATGDDGRALRMWENGVFERIPRVIEHATVGVEANENGWSIFMRDVSDALVPHDASLDETAVRQLLAGLVEFHEAFWNADIAGLCGLEDRYHLLSPRTAKREAERGNPVGETIDKCWEEFTRLVPREIADPILKLSQQPALLAEQLATCEQTLIHGDTRLANLGVGHDRVVLIDWGERTGMAPAAVEIASFLIFDAPRLGLPREDVIAEFNRLQGERFDPRALELSLIGGMVQLGANPVLDFVLSGREEARSSAVEQLRWWIDRMEIAFETWSPA